MRSKHFIIIIGLLFYLTGCGGVFHAPSQQDSLLVQLQSHLAGTSLKITRVSNTDTFQLSLPADITFQKNSAYLQSKFNPSLNAIANLLKAQPNLLAKIMGHTDIYGTLRYNQLLSEKRAQRIARYLAAQGIAESRLQTAGYGINNPIASNKKPLGRAKNRRVEILLYENACSTLNGEAGKID